MSDAPERVWIDTDRVWSDFDSSEIRDVIGEYIRADIADAARAEGWKAAMETVLRHQPIPDYVTNGMQPLSPYDRGRTDMWNEILADLRGMNEARRG